MTDDQIQLLQHNIDTLRELARLRAAAKSNLTQIIAIIVDETDGIDPNYMSVEDMIIPYPSRIADVVDRGNGEIAAEEFVREIERYYRDSEYI